MLKCWSFNSTRNVYTGTHDTASRLPGGLYDLGIDSWGYPCANHLEIRKDSMVRFVYGPLPRVLGEIDQFWESADHYKKLGVTHKRGFLLWGPHGCGKTGILAAVIEDTIGRDGLAFQVSDIEDFQRGLTMARQIEAGRPIVAILEDVEKIAECDEEALLEAMDGNSSLGDGLLFVATTNNLKSIPARIRCRPSRIDTLIEIGHPEKDQRYEYLKFLLGCKYNEPSPLAQEWAGFTDGFSLAALKEFVISVKVYRKSINETMTTLRMMSE